MAQMFMANLTLQRVQFWVVIWLLTLFILIHNILGRDMVHKGHENDFNQTCDPDWADGTGAQVGRCPKINQS